MLESLPVDDLWINIKHVLSTTKDKHIPAKMISLNTNFPWFRQTHQLAARHKRRDNDMAKSKNAQGDWEVHRKLRRSLDRSLRKCRSEHINAIGDNLMTSNSKPSLKLIKSFRQTSTGILSLSTINGTATSTIDKADALNNQFQSVFTKEECSNLPTFSSSPTKSMLPIQISSEGIVKLLKELKQLKALSSDCIITTILETCSVQVAPLLQQILQKSLDKEKKVKRRNFKVLFLRKAHGTEHPSRGCPHLVLISQLSRLRQCR